MRLELEGDKVFLHRQERLVEVEFKDSAISDGYLGELLFQSMEGREAISELYEYRVRIQNENANLQAEDFLGQEVSLILHTETFHQTRYLHGIVADWQFLGSVDATERYWLYEFVIRPPIWYASLGKDCRIFQDESVVDIIRTILSSYQLVLIFEMIRSYPQRAYCVQYRESDWNFVARLMYEEGIHFHFRHHKDKLELVFHDDTSVFKAQPGYEKIPYIAPSRLNEVTGFTATISHWQSQQTVHASHYETEDYNFEYPNTRLDSHRWIDKAYLPDTKYYEWPGYFNNAQESSDYADVRMHYLQYQSNWRRAYCSSMAIPTGAVFELVNHPRQVENSAYLILATEFFIRESAYHSDDEQAGREAKLRFTLQASDAPIINPPQFHMPVIEGPQTAVVVAYENNDIQTDQYGRVLVRFRWDRRNDKPQVSCWIRVSQLWASSGYGAIQIPREGDEVLVSFEHGHPDRPLITGSFYNVQNQPPWDLPKHATRMGLYSRSSTEGDSSQANMIYLEDRQGQEEVHVHAERNLVIQAENDREQWIGANERNKTGLNRSDEVGEVLSIKAGQRIRLECGLSVLEMHANGLVTVNGRHLKLTAGEDVDIDSGLGYFVDIN